MSLLSALTGRDRPGEGRHYADRMRAILGACSAMRLYTIDKATGTRHALVVAAPGVDIIAPEHGFVERYPLQVHPSILDKVLGMARQFAYALNVDSVSVERQGGIVWVTVPVEHPRTLTFARAWELKPGIPHGHVLLGITPRYDQLTLDLAANYHVGVIGQTRSGKSTLMLTMILSAQLAGWQIALFDPGNDFAPLSGHPAIWQGGHFANSDEIAKCLQYLAAKTSHNENVGNILAFVDEGKVLGRRQDVLQALATLTQMGSHSGVHVILGAQDSTGFGVEIANNLRAKLVGRMASAQYAGLAGAPGAERLREPGAFLAYTTLADGVRFQAPMPTQAELARLCPYPPAVGVAPVCEQDMPVTNDSHQAAAGAVSIVGDSGDPGRNPDPLPLRVKLAIQAHYFQHGRPLSRRRTAALLGQDDMDQDKVDGWRDEALGRRWRT